MARKKPAFQPYSISFLDCICCGFGAVILLFVLTSGKKSEYNKNQLSDVKVDLGKLNREIDDDERSLRKLAEMLKKNNELLKKLRKEEEVITQTVTEKEKELSLVLSNRSEIEETLEILIATLEDLPTIPEELPVLTPNPVKRQYLTDFKLDGERVLFLIEASGGMMDYTQDDAIQRISDSKQEKKEAPKWQRVVRATEWLLNSLSPPSRYQVYYYSKDAHPLIKDRPFDWLDLTDRSTTMEILDNLKDIVPEGGANLERAFFVIRTMDPLPDNIIMLIDGLPTLSETMSPGQMADQETRVRMFTTARRQIPLGVPINIILYPFTGDPDAPALYWRLACDTKGSFVCPSKSWPDT